MARLQAEVAEAAAGCEALDDDCDLMPWRDERLSNHHDRAQQRRRRIGAVMILADCVADYFIDGDVALARCRVAVEQIAMRGQHEQPCAQVEAARAGWQCALSERKNRYHRRHEQWKRSWSASTASVR